MISQSIKKYVGTSRRKIARLANELKGERVGVAKAKLSFMPQKSARDLFKAVSSAEGNFQFKNPNSNPDNLKVQNILVNVGPTTKRMRPRARGSADMIKKRSCHIKVILTD